MKSPDTISLEARKIHEQAIVVDLHADTLFLVFTFGYKLERMHRNRFPRSPFCCHVDIPRMRAGGVNAIGFSLPVLSFSPTRHRDGVIKSMREIVNWAKKLENQIAFLKHPDDILTARERGIPSFFLTCEGAHGVPNDLEELRRFRALGLWSITLAHLTPCTAAFPSLLPRWTNRPLPRDGIDLIEKMEAAGIIVDLAHCGERSFIDAVDRCTRPPIVSHTGVRGTRAMWRNISDYAAKKIADKNGVIGVLFYPGFLTRSMFDTIDCVVDTIEYLLKIVGDDFIALGSDFDGWIPSLPGGLGDIGKMPHLTDRLLRAGIPADAIKKILGGNALRVLREVCGDGSAHGADV
jgi:membrane dipeptidase